MIELIKEISAKVNELIDRNMKIVRSEEAKFREEHPEIDFSVEADDYEEFDIGEKWRTSFYTVMELAEVKSLIPLFRDTKEQGDK